MPAHALVYPMFAMVLLTASTLVRLFVSRLGSVRAGAVNPRFFQIYQGASEPEASAKLARHFVNLFEAPTLFYVACLAAIATGQSGTGLVALAWLYVGVRCLHTIIHTGANVLNYRIAAYFTSWAVLLALWTRVVLGVAHR